MNNKEEAEKPDWALENAIELYHAYFEPDKKEIIERYADALRKGERKGVYDFKAALIHTAEQSVPDQVGDNTRHFTLNDVRKIINETKPL